MIPSKQTVKKLKNKIMGNKQSQTEKKILSTIERVSEQIRKIDTPGNSTGLAPFSLNSDTGEFSTTIPGGQIAAGVLKAFKEAGYECKLDRKVTKSRSSKSKVYETSYTFIRINLWD